MDSLITYNEAAEFIKNLPSLSPRPGFTNMRAMRKHMLTNVAALTTESTNATYEWVINAINQIIAEQATLIQQIASMAGYRDGSPIAGGLGQTAGTVTVLATTGSQAAVIKKKKRKRTVTEAQRVVKEKKRAQSGSHETAKPTDACVTRRVT